MNFLSFLLVNTLMQGERADKGGGEICWKRAVNIAFLFEFINFWKIVKGE